MPILKLQARGLIAAVMLAACLGLVACGGDDKKKSASSDTTAAEAAPSDTTQEAAPEDTSAAPEGDFAAQGNALCDEANAELQQLASGGEPAPLVERSAQLTEDIAALTPPEGQQEQFDALIEAVRANDAELMRIVEDGGTIEDLTNVDTSAIDAQATELGLTSCAG